MPTGVAVGSEFCGAESPAIRDPGVWVVDIGKLKLDKVFNKTFQYNSIIKLQE